MPNFRIVLTSMLVAAGLSAQSTAADSPAHPAFQVIVNPANPTTSIDHKLLLDAFLRRTTRWPDGQPVSPVDLPANSPTRQRFSNDALRRSVAAVKGYWLQIIFSGHGVPPPELDSDEQIVTFVAKTPGGIGYVSGAAKIKGTRAISIN